MDDHTLEKLNFERVRQMLAQQAACALGRSLALRIRPSRRKSQVTMWLDQARALFSWVSAHGLPPFGGIRDVRDMVKRCVPPASLEPEQFAEVAATLSGVDALRRYFAGTGEEHGPVGRLAARIGDFSIVAARIGRVIDTRGRVRDDASDRLQRIRDEIQAVRQRTKDVFDRLVRQPSIVKLLQYPNATFHADRMVLPLRAEQRGRLPGIVHRSSDSGQTLFVEPAEAVELNNKRISLLQSEQEEIARILWELAHLVHLNQSGILQTLEAVALVDLLAAKVKFAERYEMHVPRIGSDRRLLLKRARNPILMATFEEEAAAGKPARSVVPIDVRLGDDFDIMLITGPNTGGKTATLKTVGLLVLMAQAGLPIPADPGSILPMFDGVFIDIGDEQSLEQSLSTFSAHLSRILDIVKRAQKTTLVIMDELGAGTDPDEGAAIGRSIVDRLCAVGCLAMVTTHLGALKAVGFEKKRVDNASVQFDIESLQPTFELRIGEPGNSHAIAIAARLGMPRRMVEDAKRQLAGRNRALNKAIAGTLKSRRDAERARRDADNARADAARATLAAMDKAAEMEKTRRTYEAWVARVIQLQPGDPVRVRRFDKPGRIVRVGLEKQNALVDLGAMEVEVPLTELVFDGQ
ncbi:MAG: DNA strand exchange inhibitor protein [Planctomycetota bacterium]|nr:DNA strand exchange inhibitor protein [Planctomycetota bacterium]